MQRQFIEAYQQLQRAYARDPKGTKLFAFEMDKDTPASALMEFLGALSENITISKLLAIDVLADGNFAMRGVATWEG